MRKSIKRIVSSVLAATMVLTSCVVSNVSFAFAAATGGTAETLPIEVTPTDEGNRVIEYDSVLFGTELKLSTTLSVSALDKAGALLTVQGDNDGKTQDTAAKLRMDTKGVLCIDNTRTVTLATINPNEDHTIEFIINTEDGTFQVSIDGGAPVSNENFKDTKLTKGVSAVKVSKGNNPTDNPDATAFRTTTVKEVKWSGNEATGSSTDPETQTTTEPDTQTTTDASVAEGSAVIKPVVNAEKSTADKLVIDYVINLGANATFNNYTLFVNFAPDVLEPVSADYGDIKLDEQVPDAQREHLRCRSRCTRAYFL